MNREKINNISRVAPIVMSLISLALVIEGVFEFGLHSHTHPQTDEGWQAHIFQLLMVLQLPIVIVFVATANWKPFRRPLAALGLQIGAWAVVAAAVPILL